ncbi:MAG TPA: MFS transporter [Burkholderiales bacterium]|nr:MFS transporter [Burkholderiales bacterium]
MLGACFALNMFGRGLGDTYAVFIVPLEREFGWARSQLTGVYSIYLLVNGFTAPLVGLAFDRLGPRWVYGIGLSCLGAAFFFAAGLTSLLQFYVFIGAMVGIAVSFNGMVPASALLSRWYPTRLSTAIGIAYSATGIGTLLFVPLAQYLVAAHGWRVTYQALGVGLLALAPVAMLALPWERFRAGRPEERRSREKAAGEGWTLASAVRSPVFWGLAQIFFCTAAGMFSIIVQLVAFLIEAGFSPLTAASAFGAIGMLSALSIMGSGFLSDRFGYRQTASVSFVGTAVGMMLLLLITAWPSALLLAAFVPIFGLCMGVRGPIVSSIGTRYFAGPRVATIYGVIYATNAVGAALGSWLGGLLHDLTGGYRWGLAMALAFIVCAAAPFWTVPALRNYR